MSKPLIFLTMLAGLFFFLFQACCDDEDNDIYCEEQGTIIGVDYRECACCGGWFIEIGDDTLRAWTLPQEFAQSLDPMSLPVPVLLEWSPKENPCLGDEIDVECIRRT